MKIKIQHIGHSKNTAKVKLTGINTFQWLVGGFKKKGKNEWMSEPTT